MNMIKNFTLTGGARIGMANATYPFAKLYVDKNVLKINASIVSNLVFQPNDITSIDPYRLIPFVGQGVKINHRVEKYNSKVIFWTFKDPKFVIDNIKKVGFLDHIADGINIANVEIIKRQQQGGFPIKRGIAIIFILAWNLFLLSDFIPFFFSTKTRRTPIGHGTQVALGLLLLTAILTLLSVSFRKLILKEAREFNDIKKFVYLIIFVSGVLFLAFTVSDLSR